MFAKLRTARTWFAAAGLALSCLTGLAVPAVSAAQVPYLQLNAVEPKYAAIVIDANSGEVLYDKRA
ncbi:peptidase M15, partial [Pseudomonas sp. HMWF010]